MFHADWILGQAGPPPDPARERRPGLLRRGQLGEPIRPAWPVVGELRDIAGRYPGDGAQVDSSRADNALSPVLEQPGTMAWAAAIRTVDEPTVAIPLADAGHTVRLIRAFELNDGDVMVVALDLCRLIQGRNKPSRAAIGAVRIFTAARQVAEEELREILEDSYLRMDPKFRDRVLRADENAEPIVLVIGEPTVMEDAAAVAATFGMTIEPIAANIARDYAALSRMLAPLGGLLAAAFLWEQDTQNLIWVADVVASLTRADLPRSHFDASPGPALRASMRRVLSDVAAGQFEPEPSLIVTTCRRCQPTVSRAIAEHHLEIGTIGATDVGGCVCGGGQSDGHSIRLSLAVQLAEIENLLIIGYQGNFDAVTAAVNGADVRHINNAGAAKSAAERADFAIVVTGSVMGHSDSQPYVDAVEAREIPMARTASSQLSDVIRMVFDEAVRRKPELRLGLKATELDRHG